MNFEKIYLRSNPGKRNDIFSSVFRKLEREREAKLLQEQQELQRQEDQRKEQQLKIEKEAQLAKEAEQRERRQQEMEKQKEIEAAQAFIREIRERDEQEAQQVPSDNLEISLGSSTSFKNKLFSKIGLSLAFLYIGYAVCSENFHRDYSISFLIGRFMIAAGLYGLGLAVEKASFNTATRVEGFFKRIAPGLNDGFRKNGLALARAEGNVYPGAITMDASVQPGAIRGDIHPGAIKGSAQSQVQPGAVKACVLL